MNLYDSLVGLITEKERGTMVEQPYGDYETAQSLAQAHEPELKRLLAQASGNNDKVITDIKSQESFDSKVGRGKAPERINDVLRASIYAHNQENMDRVLSRLRKRGRINKEEDRRVPDPDDPTGYHGTVHYLVEVGHRHPDLPPIMAEIIVMTKRAKAAKKEAHKLYDKHRDTIKKGGYGGGDEQGQDEEVERDMRLSKAIFNYANRAQRRLPKKGKERRLLRKEEKALQRGVEA